MQNVIDACNRARAQLIERISMEQVSFQRIIAPLNEGVKRLDEILQSFGQAVEPLITDGIVGKGIPVRASADYTYVMPVEYRYNGELYEIAFVALEQNLSPNARYTFDPRANKHILHSPGSDREMHDGHVPIEWSGGLLISGAYYRRASGG